MDKKELRKDPIREKILSFLTYIEDNKIALYGIVALVMLVILVGSYMSTTTKELQVSSSLSFGKAINSSIAGNKDASVSIFSNLLEEGSESTAGNSFAYLIDYYLSSGDFSKVDSMLIKNIKIKDNILQSKVFILQGDMSLNKMEYNKSIDFYSKAAKLYPPISNKMNFKKAIAHYQLGDFKKSRSIIENLLDLEDLSYEVKNQCEKYLFMLDNKV